MFKKNDDHEQESLFSPIKNRIILPEDENRTSMVYPFYQHVFTQIDEKKFAGLYNDGYSRPNKPVNVLVSLEIIKHLMDLSDEELEHAYLFDFRVRNALGKESLGDNICPKTFTNFRRRLLEYEEETGRDLLHEVFEAHRNCLKREFQIDATTQRMDSTLIEANIKELSRMDLIGKVVYNFLNDLSPDLLRELPAGMEEFAGRDKSELTYEVGPSEAQAIMETLAEHAGWLVDRFEHYEPYNESASYAYLQRVLDEQCYRIPELEEDEDEEGNDNAGDHDDDDESPGWEPHRKFTPPADITGGEATEDIVVETDENEEGDDQNRITLKDPTDIGSDSLHNPHDDEATYRRKLGEEYFGYKANLAETCASGDKNPFRLITAVQVDTNNTDDGDLLEEDVDELPYSTSLVDLLVDGGYTHNPVEANCKDHGITQHFTGIKGMPPREGTLSLAEFDWDGHELVACPAGHEPLEHRYKTDSGRFSFRMAKEHCEGCEYKDNCYVEEKQEFYSFGFWERKLVIAKRRARLSDPASEEFLNQRAGAESMINEVYHKTGKRTKFTGKIKVENATIAKAIGTNLKRVSRHLNEEAEPTEMAA